MRRCKCGLRRSARKESRLSGPFRYLEHVRKVNQIFSRSLWKSEKSWDFEKMKLKIELEYSDKTPFFWAETFFQRPLEIFLLTLRTCSRCLKGPLNLALCVRKKNRDRTTHLSDFMSGKVKKVEILKKWSSKSSWDILTKPHFFWAETFFKGL